MAKYLGPKCKLSRREGYDLNLKSGIKSIDKKCKINVLPGQKSSRKTRVSDYGLQLREKQKVRRIYGVFENQFKRYYKVALKKKTDTGKYLLELLERRLDNFVYRSGFASTRAEARQLVSHKSILVNDKVCNIPSLQLKNNDIVKIHDKSKNQLRIKNAMELSKNNKIMSWIDSDIKNFISVFQSTPIRNEIYSDINEQLIIELYSK